LLLLVCRSIDICYGLNQEIASEINKKPQDCKSSGAVKLILKMKTSTKKIIKLSIAKSLIFCSLMIAFDYAQGVAWETSKYLFLFPTYAIGIGLLDVYLLKKSEKE
jgi:hypothetical protein